MVMKTAFLIAFAGAMAFVATGCSGGSNNNQTPQTNTTANNSPIVQPEVYAQRKVDVANLTQAIQQYNAAEGHYPQTLQDLAPNYMAKIPQPPPGYKITYDPNSGAVNILQQ